MNTEQADLKIFNYERKFSFLMGFYFENTEIDTEYNSSSKDKSKWFNLMFTVSITLYHIYELADLKLEIDRIYLDASKPLLISLYSVAIALLLIFSLLLAFTAYSKIRQNILCCCILIVIEGLYMLRLLKLYYTSNLNISDSDLVGSETSDCINDLRLYKQIAIIEINLFRAAMEGVAYMAYSLNPSIAMITMMLTLKLSIFVYFGNLFVLSTAQIIFGINGLCCIYFLTFILKRLSCSQLFEIFVQKKKMHSTNEYFAGFIRDLNNPILTMDEHQNYLNSNLIFDKEFNSTLLSITQDSHITTSNQIPEKSSTKHPAQEFFANFFSFESNENLSNAISSVYLVEEGEINGSEKLPKYNIFKSVGLYYSELNQKKKYYEISFRSFYSYNSLVCLDIIFHDITQLKNSEAINTEIQLKGSMFSKIAHEFKTPLITITSQLDTLDEKINDLETDEYSSNIGTDKYYKKLEEIQEISVNIKHLSHYTNFLILDIIQYSSKTSKEIDIKYEKLADVRVEIINFSNCILKALITYTCGKKDDISHFTVWDEEINHYSLKTDKTRLNQIILNLLSNSVKFTKAGSIELRCYLKKNEKLLGISVGFDKADSKDIPEYRNLYSRNSSCLPALFEDLVISIKDTGNGIPKAVMDRLAAGDNTLSSLRDYKNSMGSGLGLGIARTICSLMNYDFQFYSKDGEGTIFQILIPLHIKKNVVKAKVHVLNNAIFNSSVNNDESVPSIRINSLNQTYSGTNGIPESQRINNSQESIILVFPQECEAAKLEIARTSAKRTTQLKNVNYVTTNCQIALKVKRTTSPIKFRKNVSRNYETFTDTSVFKHKLIICDDSLVIRDSIETLFKSIPDLTDKYSIVKLEDGSSLLPLIINDQKLRSVKAVFIDENMEYLNGSEAIKTIIDLENSGKLNKGRLYFSLTAYDEESFRTSLLQKGFTKVLSKPLTKIETTKLFKDYHLV